MRKMGEACMICMTGPSRKRGGGVQSLRCPSLPSLTGIRLIAPELQRSSLCERKKTYE